MNSEYGSEQRNSSLDTLKQRQKTSPTMPTLTSQQANILYTMPLQTVERLEQVLRSTLALQESIRRDMDSLATKKSLEPLATADLLARWLNQTKDLHQGMCQDLEKVQRGIQEENRQAGKQRDEFMRQLSTVIERLRRDGKNCRHPSGAGQPLRSCAPWRERRRPAFWCGGFWDNRRHYSVAGQIGTAAGQQRNRRNDPAQSWRPKSAGQRAGKEDRHGAQSG